MKDNEIDNEIDSLLENLEYTKQKPEFFKLINAFDKNIVEKSRNSIIENKGKFPFGSFMPKGSIDFSSSNDSKIVIHTVYYVPYVPPRRKELYPYKKKNR